MASELISVIIRTYNTGAFVYKAIESVLSQASSLATEILVVDDGSTDDTLKKLSTYKNHIRLIASQHQGSIAALNTGIKNCYGSHFLILDSDDQLLPNSLQLLYSCLEKEPEKGFAYADYIEKDKESGLEKIVSVNADLFKTIAGGILFKREIVLNIGGYDESLVFPEYDVLLKLLPNFPGRYLAVPVYIYNRRVGSITSDSRKVSLGKKQLESKYGPLPDLRNY